jgi:hypothetical protein
MAVIQIFTHFILGNANLSDRRKYASTLFIALINARSASLIEPPGFSFISDLRGRALSLAADHADSGMRLRTTPCGRRLPHRSLHGHTKSAGPNCHSQVHAQASARRADQQDLPIHGGMPA